MGKLTKKLAGAYHTHTAKINITNSDVRGHKPVLDMFNDTVEVSGHVVNDCNPTTSIGGGNTPVLRDVNSNSQIGDARNPKNLVIKKGHGKGNFHTVINK